MIIFILLNLLDSLLTYLGITLGKCEEGNILFHKLFEENIFLGLGIKRRKNAKISNFNFA